MAEHDTVTIQLTAMEAELFKQYRKHEPLFIKLLQKKIFDIRDGKATLHFNNDGLRNIEVTNNYRM
jgi:hypothetical protein